MLAQENDLGLPLDLSNFVDSYIPVRGVKTWFSQETWPF